jgi:hypothetical protein
MNLCNVGHSYSATLNNGAANSTGEEQIDLPCATQDASVQVQKQTRLFCHRHCAKSEENSAHPQIGNFANRA